LSPSGDNTRGIAINKTTGNVLWATRSPVNAYVIRGVDGSDIGALNNTGISGGALSLDQIRVADDGVIYAANLQGAGVQNFKIYRWNSEADGQVNAPTVAFDNGSALTLSNLRYGDSMDIRGSGTNTQIIVGSSSATAIALFTTTDGTNFTPTEINHTLGAGELGYMLTFDGTKNGVYGKKLGTILHYAAFTISPPSLTLITNITIADSVGPPSFVGGKQSYSNGVNFVVGVLTSTGTSTNNNHRFKAYTLATNPPSAVVSGDLAFPAPVAGNGNTIAASDIGAGMAVGIDVNNGIVAAALSFVTNLPPSIVGQPQGSTNVLQGGYFTLTVSASGTAPLRYQWRLNATNNLSNATNASLTLTNLQLTNSGLLSCLVTNSFGSVTSQDATITVVPSVQTAAAASLWSKSVGELFFLSTDNSQRGMAYNPTSGHLIVVSRFPSNGVHLVEGATGNYIASLDMSAVSLIPGATFAVNMAGVADDGAIYVMDLGDVSTSPGNHTQIYRWANELPGTVATIAYPDGDPGVGRIGDTLAVRGAGTNTQIIAASRNGTQLVLFTTTDGTTFTPTTLDDATEPAGFAGLGLAFGAGDTLWTKTSGFQFRHLAFDATAGTHTLLQTFGAGQLNSIFLGVDSVNDLLAGVVPDTGAGTRPVPNHIDLYDVHDVVNGLAAEPNLIDQDFLPTSTVNANGVGSVTFDVGSGRLFALNANNGLLALSVVARLFPHGTRPALTWTGPSALQSSTNVVGPYSDIGGATSPYTNLTSRAASFFRLRR
jgi:hypothetical protein